MDFFEAQDRARRRTKWLVLLFVLALLGTIASSYLAAVGVMTYANRANDRRHRYAPAAETSARLWDPALFLWIAAGTTGVVGIASLVKWSQFRAGGSAVAESVGGRRVDSHTRDLAERRLLNVVEEMAIASGIPVPAVYVLDDEPAINAFAAGLTTHDAAIAVTRGTLDKLTRDELQGVIGHEFSHVLNGDMRLNVKLTAIIFGILVIGLIGRGILRGLMQGRVRSGGGKNKGNGVVVIAAIGLALFLIGYIGYFFGRLIQAAVSRQREFLADASAVQFTRNPDGVAGALKKIGGYALGGTMNSGKAGEIGHFFFAQAFRTSLAGLWATHPPLEERIRAVEPRWDGRLFEPPTVVDVAHESAATAGFAGGPRYAPEETLRRVEAAPADLPPPLPPTARIPFQPARVVADIGAVTDAHFRQARQLLDSLPTRLREAAREPAAAQALVYGLLLTGRRADRDAQQALVARHAGAAAAATLGELRSALSLLEPVARLPLLQLALPALRQLDGADLDRFAGTLDELVHADAVVTPFEFALQKMLLTQLRGARQPARTVAFDSFSAVTREIGVVLSALAQLTPAGAATSFAAGAGQLPGLADRLALLPPDQCGLAALDGALDKLAASSFPIKKRLLVAAAQVIASDGEITVEEGELYRALAATLEVPMPNLSAAA